MITPSSPRRSRHIVVGIPAGKPSDIDRLAQIAFAVQQRHDRDREVHPAGPPLWIRVVLLCDQGTSVSPIAAIRLVPLPHIVDDWSNDRIGRLGHPGGRDEFTHIGLEECLGVHVGVESAGIDGGAATRHHCKPTCAPPRSLGVTGREQPENLGFELGVHCPSTLGVQLRRTCIGRDDALIHEIAGPSRRDPDIAVQVVDPFGSDLRVRRFEPVLFHDVKVEPFDVCVVVGGPTVEEDELDLITRARRIEPDAFNRQPGVVRDHRGHPRPMHLVEIDGGVDVGGGAATSG